MTSALLVDWPTSRSMAQPNFEQLFAEHAPHVGRTLRYLGVAEADVQDGCQEVFIVVHRRLPELDPAASSSGWIRQICVHVAQNLKRSVRRRRESGDAVPVVAEPPTQHGSAERNQMRARLLSILDGLSEEQRAVFVLYEIEQLGMAEVAAALGCPLQTAYSRLHAARARVQQGMKEGEVVS